MNYTKETLKLFWRLVRPNPWLFVSMILSDILATVFFRIIPPLYATEIIKRLSSGDYIQGDFWGSFSREIIIFSVSLIVGGVFLKRIELWLRFRLEMKAEQRIKTMLHDKYLELDTGFHADNFSGSLTSRSGKLVTSYVRFADSIFHPTVQMLSVIVSVYIIVAQVALSFLAVFTLIAIVFAAIAFKLSPWVSKIFIAKARVDNTTTGLLADSITNITTVKSYANSKHERKMYRRSTEESKLLLGAAARAVLIRDTLFGSITTFFSIAALVVAVIAIVEQNANLAIAFLLLTYADNLVDQLFFFGTAVINNFDRSMGDAQDGVDTLLKEPAIKDPKNPKKLTVTKAEIEFKNATFTHGGTDEALFKNFNLRIMPGEKIGLVGHSGGGKSTLTKLIMRFMDLDEGEILIDGQNISHTTQDDLRNYLAYVPQEPVMFHRSIKENIGYGNLSATDQMIEDAAKSAHAHDFVENLPKGYATLVGERGIKLSGGQRQRVAIARAILKNSPILLLDEATSALDSESEQLIQDALWKLMENKTAIVIAHRLSTIQKMDRIIVLENGRIAEEGSHKDLLQKNGTYAKLWAHQSGGFIEE